MSSLIRRAWSDYLHPLLARPDRFQMAALCYRMKKGQPEVLLITSLHTGRWIIPKGWPMRGRDAAGGAAAEAWEEAGVVPRRVDPSAIGSFRYLKKLRGGVEVPCETKVFLIQVEKLADEYPQKGKRRRKWVSTSEAAAAVDEPGLRDLLTELPQRLADRAS